VPFPFSDLSGAKLRPAIVLAPAGRDDWLMCQVTSNPYSDPLAIRLTASDMREGSLHSVSFARPLKVFTANAELVAKRIAVLRPEPFETIVDALIHALRGHK
jgi:mRNA interferase MazF